MEKAIKEIRLTELRAVKDEEEMIVEGYAVVFNKQTDLGWCKETIDSRAFDDCDMSDVSLKYEHSNSFLTLARTRNKSLELEVDEKGLKIRAKLIDTTQNKDIYKMIKEGLLDKMSFGFKVRKSEWNYETDERRILEFEKLYEVSIVNEPAYEDTEVYARSKDSYLKEKEKYNNLQLQKEKLKLKLSL